MQITVVEHPLIKHKLSKMRDVQTTSRDFREWLDEIAMLMTYEVTRDLAVERNHRLQTAQQHRRCAHPACRPWPFKRRSAHDS